MRTEERRMGKEKKKRGALLPSAIGLIVCKARWKRETFQQNTVAEELLHAFPLFFFLAPVDPSNCTRDPPTNLPFVFVYVRPVMFGSICPLSRQRCL